MALEHQAPTFWPNAILQGRPLRYVLLDELRRRPQMSVAEMVATLTNRGFCFAGRPSKVISDALRWELRAGRAERLARGVYRYRPTPRSYMRRVALLARISRRWVDAWTAGEALPPPPPDSRPSSCCPPGPGDPPWAHLGWLWCS